MLSPSSEIPPFPQVVDSSMLTTYRACPRKFGYNYLHHLRLPGQSIHLVAGGAFAAGLEAARREVFIHREKLPIEDLLVAAWPPFMKEWGSMEPPEDAPKSFINVFDALGQYLERWHPYDDPIQPLVLASGEPAVEFSFAIPLPIKHPTSGDPILFAGRFDLLGTYNKEFNCILDEKTTSALGASWLRQWDLRGQFLGYVWACQQLGYKVDNVFVRGTAIKKTGTDFLVAPLQYPKHVVERWHEQLLITVQRMIEEWKLSFFPYVFGEACASYGGCAFIPLCSAPDDDRWASQYEAIPWNPIKAGA